VPSILWKLGSLISLTVCRRPDKWHVTCPHCLRFTLDPYHLGLFESARHRGDVRILHLLPRWSQAARQTAGEGGRLNLIAEHWQAVASCATPGDR
jgi:hypothetical protein